MNKIVFYKAVSLTGRLAGFAAGPARRDGVFYDEMFFFSRAMKL